MPEQVSAPVGRPVFPDVVLTTSRLVLRGFAAADVDAVVAAANDAETQRWLPLPRPYLHDGRVDPVVAAMVRVDLRPDTT